MVRPPFSGRCLGWKMQHLPQTRKQRGSRPHAIVFNKEIVSRDGRTNGKTENSKGTLDKTSFRLCQAAGKFEKHIKN